MSARDLAQLLLLLPVLLAALYVQPPIATRGEAREALVVRELAAGGDWLLPRRQGVVASKPPLYHWLAALGVRALGWSDAAVRLPSVLAAWLVAALTFAVARLVAGRGVAWLAVGVLFASWGFWRSALQARVDMVLAAGVAGAIAGLAGWSLRGDARGRAWFWVGAATAVLAKGPVGLVLPALVAAAFFASGRDLAPLRALWRSAAAAPALLVCLAWYAAAALDGGREFLAVQVMRENVDRFVGRGGFAPSRLFAWLLVPRYFLGHLAPWHLAIARDWWRRAPGAAPSPGGRLLHCWWLAILIFFTVAAGKRAVYLLPLYPAVAILAARALAHDLVPRVGRAPVAVAVAVAALAMLLASHRGAMPDAAARGLLSLAGAAARAVPTGAELYASRGLSENDLLVLAHVLGRPLERRWLHCERAGAPAYYLRPVPSRAGAIAVERVAVVGGRELVRCPPS